MNQTASNTHSKINDIFDFLGYSSDRIELHKLSRDELSPIVGEATKAYPDFARSHPDAACNDPFKGLPDDHPLVVNWLAEHVLPSIAKKGSYFCGQEDFAQGLITAEQFYRRALQGTAKQLSDLKMRMQ